MFTIGYRLERFELSRALGHDGLEVANLNVMVRALLRAAVEAVMKTITTLSVAHFLILMLANSAVGQVTMAEVGQVQESAYSGDADAQLRLGLMYKNGTGKPKSAFEATRWLERAAAQAHSEAPYYLARIYADGDDLPVNNATAYKWLLIAKVAGGKHEEMIVLYGEVLERLTKKEILEGQNMADQWFVRFKPRY